MKKKWIILGAAVLVVALVVLAVILISKSTGDSNTVVICGVTYDINITSLDLNGQRNPDIEEILKLKQLKELDMRGTLLTIENYERLRAALPDCYIRWNVPVDGFYNDNEGTVVTVIKFTEEGLDALKYFPNLEQVDGFECEDYEYLALAQRQYPDVDVWYKVPLGMAEIQSDCTGLKLKKLDVEALRHALTYLPNLRDVTFDGEQPTEEELKQLKEDFPEVNFK